MKKMMIFGLVVTSLIASSSFAAPQKLVKFHSRLDFCIANLDLVDSSGKEHPTIVLYGKHYGTDPTDGPTERPVSHTFELTGISLNGTGLNYIKRLTIHQETRQEIEKKGISYLIPKFILPDLIIDENTNRDLFELINKNIDEDEQPSFVIRKNNEGKIIIDRKARFPFSLLWD